MEASVVLDEQNARCRNGSFDQFACAHTLLGKRQNAWGERGNKQPMIALIRSTKEAREAELRRLSIEATIQ